MPNWLLPCMINMLCSRREDDHYQPAVKKNDYHHGLSGEWLKGYVTQRRDFSSGLGSLDEPPVDLARRKHAG